MDTSLRENQGRAESSHRKRVALVLNEKAGGVLGSGTGHAALAAMFQESGVEVVDVPPGPLPDRLRAATELGDDIVVAGGDGTIACAARALLGSGHRLGILPCGTMNLAARDLGLPVGDFAAAASIVLAGKERVIDAAVAASDGEEHVFLCACMLGTPARLGRHREQARARGGRLLQWPLFLRALIRALRHPAALSAVLMVDGTAHKLRTPALTITVNELNDTEGRLFGRTCLDAGELCAYIVRRRRAWDMIRAFWRLAQGKPRSPALTVLRGRTMRLASPGALRVMIDGEERLLKSPVQFSIRPGALRVFAP